MHDESGPDQRVVVVRWCDVQTHEERVFASFPGLGYKGGANGAVGHLSSQQFVFVFVLMCSDCGVYEDADDCGARAPRTVHRG